MSINRLVNKFEYALFRHRAIVIVAFLLATLFLLFKATSIKLDAAFTKNIPLKHEYMQTYLRHAQDFGGANNILISLCDTRGDIFNADFFNTLRRAHDELLYTSGIDRVQVKSLFSPSTRFVEVVDEVKLLVQDCHLSVGCPHRKAQIHQVEFPVIKPR